MAEASTSSDDVNCRLLSEKDLPDLLNVLCSIAHRWEEIAAFLPNMESSIADVKGEQSESSKKLLTIIKRWLNNSSRPTVKELVVALKSNFLGEHRIAAQLEEKFLSPSLLHSVSVGEELKIKHETRFDRTKSLPTSLSAHEAKVKSDVPQHELSQLQSKPHDQHPLEKRQELAGFSDCNCDTQPAYGCDCSVQCSITDFVNDECPKQKHTSSHFPYLDAENLDEDEREMLCGQLYDEFHEINKKYASLTSSVRTSLVKRNITANDLQNKLMDFKAIPIYKGRPLLEDRCSEMKAAQSIMDIFRILKDYGSVLNHDIIEFIVQVDELGTEDDKKKMQAYKQEFTEYCRHNIFECPLTPAPKKSSKFAKLIIKVVSESHEYTLKAVQLFRTRVAKLLRVTKHTLMLHNAEDGCIQLTFRFPRFLKIEIFPLDPDQKKELRELGITKLLCDGLPQPLTSSELRKGECFERAISEKQKGDIHLQQGNCQKAVESYSQAMELDRFSADIAMCKAEALFRQELYADAEETCSLALSLDDHCSKAYFIRARAKNKLGRLEESIEDFKFTLKLDPTNKEADTQLARLQGEFRRRTVKKYKRGNKCDLPPLEETCEVPHKPLPELEVVKVLDEWECKMSLRSLLGEEVLVSSNLSEKVPVDVFEREGSVIGLFFSGIWCPPSKVFTPELIDWYNRFKKGPKGKLLNIVFVSSDEDEESWREYSSGMPWYGVNFNDEARQRKLVEKYDVTYIPKLVFVEGKTGNINTTEGRSIVSKDPLGEGFPWKQKTFTEIMANGKLLDQSNEITWEQLKGKVVGLFFSGYDCIPAIAFTFKLVPLYENLKKAKKEFEIIYVSFDEDERDWQTYSKSMPWVSLPYDDERTVELRKLFDVQDIPTLILMDGEGGLITTEGCSCVESDPEGTNFPWYRHVDTLTKFTPGNTTDSETYMAQLIWFLPHHLMKRAKEILEPLAKEYISSKAETKMEIKLLFFIARDGDEASYDARRFARLPQQIPLLTILDMEHNQVHISTSDEVTEENAKKFVYDFLQKRLFGRKLITK